MPALVAGIHVFNCSHIKDVDGRDKPGHDAGMRCLIQFCFNKDVYSGRTRGAVLSRNWFSRAIDSGLRVYSATMRSKNKPSS
jgi:hypothetical protein